MTNYDFLTLSSTEFESISRDLLQKELSVFIESFTTGRDGGIDLRFSKDKSSTTIIQAKRYKDYSSLYSHLKKEADKVKNLKPSRYIITTSVGLTPSNKEEIKTLFTPYIINTADILGRDDLNNLLSVHQEVERKYYKLWLSSTAILEKIMHSRIVNQSAFELDEIREQVKLFVQNDSLNHALTILNKYRYVIISGIPGIGKTTLSRILTLYLLSSGFNEFVYLNDSIDDGYTFFKDGEKQIFFFDDFLGKNFFEAGKQNEDNKIVKFIEKIKKSPDKAMILATREYILKQAQTTYEAFRISNIEIAKCVLDLSSYTSIIKAQILYNHIFFADIPQGHLMNLVNSENHLQLVHHPNYNPRIIETVINRKVWEYCSPEDFSKVFKSFFDNPESVWEYAFENSLNKFSQYALLVLVTTGTPILIEDWEKALREFLLVNSYKFLTPYDTIFFNRSIHELENTFIRTQKDSYSAIAVGYQNPSIQDFLVNYLKNKRDLIKSLLKAALFTDQFFSVFTTDNTDNYNTRRKILLNDELISDLVTRLINTFQSLKTCEVFYAQLGKSASHSWLRNTAHLYSFLNTMFDELSHRNAMANDFLYKVLQDNININSYSYSEQAAYIDLLGKVDLTRIEHNQEQIIDNLINYAHRTSHFELFARIKNIFPTTYSDTIKEKKFFDKIESVLTEEITSVEDSDLTDLCGRIEGLEILYELGFDDKLNEIKKKEAEYDAYLESQAESYIEERDGEPEDDRYFDEEKTIAEIFNSLIDYRE